MSKVFFLSARELLRSRIGTRPAVRARVHGLSLGGAGQELMSNKGMQRIANKSGSR